MSGTHVVYSQIVEVWNRIGRSICCDNESNNNSKLIAYLLCAWKRSKHWCILSHLDLMVILQSWYYYNLQFKVRKLRHI